LTAARLPPCSLAGLLLIVFTLIHRSALEEYITAIAVGGGLVVVGGILAWAGYQANAKERLASITANKEIRLASIAATKDLGQKRFQISPPALSPRTRSSWSSGRTYSIGR